MTPTTAAERTNISYPWDAQKLSVNHNVTMSAGAPALETESQKAALAPEMDSSPSTTVDIGPDLNPTAKLPSASLWSRVVKTANVVEEHLAEWFGLTQSKYQWAVDEYADRQLSGESQATPAPPQALDKFQTEPLSQQAMNRDTVCSIDTV